jgi:hypothetical protein
METIITLQSPYENSSQYMNLLFASPNYVFFSNIDCPRSSTSSQTATLPKCLKIIVRTTDLGAPQVTNYRQKGSKTAKIVVSHNKYKCSPGVCINVEILMISLMMLTKLSKHCTAAALKLARARLSGQNLIPDCNERWIFSRDSSISSDFNL